MATKMGIVNYETRLKRCEKRIMEDQAISSTNKKLLQRFLLGYDVRPATRQIFLERIRLLLQKYPRVESALTDKDGITALFAELRAKYAPATVATYLRVIRVFLRWLNDGDDVPALKNVKSPKKSSQKRIFEDEHPTFQEIERIASHDSSVQVQAMITSQGDVGFRPSAFINLNYGNIRWVHGIPIARVIKGKVCTYEAVLFRAAEYVRKWMEIHPTKNPNDPLWISESCLLKTDGPINPRRYSYAAVNKRFKLVAKRAGYEGPFFLLALRHASCANDKRENIPTDIAAGRHNHSVKHFVETYGQIKADDEVERMVLHMKTTQAARAQSFQQQAPPPMQYQHPSPIQQPMQPQQPHAQHYPTQNQPMGMSGVGMQPQQMHTQPYQQPMQQQPNPVNVSIEEMRLQQEQQKRILELATAHLR